MPENENEAKIELTKSPSLDAFLRARHQRMPSFEFKIDEKDKKDAKKHETEPKTPVIEEEFEFPTSSNAETEKNEEPKLQNFKRSKKPKTPVIEEEFEFPTSSNAETEMNEEPKLQNFQRSNSFSFPPLRRQKEFETAGNEEEIEFATSSNAEKEKNKLAQKFQNFKRSISFPLRRQKDSPTRT
ncbi:hypothetical protein niasHS_016476 [Heterodera schachtii]|uniref:Uncharacterized protein n=1 Tax=Heterodera schachtii TaxID=97005 RepID=A0ABD2HPK6_HETSC